MAAPAETDELEGDSEATLRRPLTIHDVTILFPLTSDAEAILLPLAAPGLGGPLFPERYASALPDLFSRRNPPYASWRIISARVDPCFPTLALMRDNPAACRRQLRLVGQPLVSSLGVTRTRDLAIHLLYDLDDDAFAGLAEGLAALGADADKQTSFAPHRRMQREGLRGSTARTAMQLITSHVGAGNLRRVAFSSGNIVTWDWGIFDVVNGRLRGLPIAGMQPQSTRQVLNASDTTGIYSATGKTPTMASLMALAGTTTSGMQVVLTASPEAQRAALEASQTVDNPASPVHPESVDCVSCHIAGRARARAKLLGAPSEIPGYATSHNVTLTTDQVGLVGTTHVRALGYFEAQPSVSQRALNESAAVADALTQWLAAR